MRLRFLTSAAVLFTAPTVPAAAEIRAVVIGVDDYQHIKKLKGASNDAKDIAAQLAKYGVKDITTLLDRQVSRDSVLKAFKTVHDRAKPDDLVVISFAGHGVQEPERVKGSETDGMDEVFLLSGFQEKGPGTKERLFDDEMNQWLVKFGERKAKVLFIADSCHSGTATRSVDPRVAGELTTRIGPRYQVTEEMLAEIPPPSPAPEAALPHVTFLSGGQDTEQVPEIRINGAPRGALSYSVSRAIEGVADADQDGTITRRELYHYVRKTTRELAESRQTPNFEPQDGLDEPVFTRGAAPVAGVAQNRAFTLRIIGPASAASTFAANVSAGTLAIADKDADLIWDVGAKQMISGKGDIIAHEVDAETARGVVDRSIAVQKLLTLPRRAGAQTAVTPNDTLHQEGSEIGFTIEGIGDRYLIPTSISADGKVHWLGLESGPDRTTKGSFAAKFRVTPPFGADMIVIFISETQDKALERSLRALDGSRAAKDLLAIAEKLDPKRVEILLQGIYTSPRKS